MSIRKGSPVFASAQANRIDVVLAAGIRKQTDSALADLKLSDPTNVGLSRLMSPRHVDTAWNVKHNDAVDEEDEASGTDDDYKTMLKKLADMRAQQEKDESDDESDDEDSDDEDGKKDIFGNRWLLNNVEVVAQRVNWANAKGVAVLAYTNVMNTLMSAYQRGDLNEAHFVAYPQDASLTMGMVPYIAFFLPLDAWQQQWSLITETNERLAPVMFTANRIMLTLNLSQSESKCIVKILMKAEDEDIRVAINQLVEAVQTNVLNALNHLYNNNPEFVPVTLELALVKSAVKRMVAAFEACFKRVSMFTIPLTLQSIFQGPYLILEEDYRENQHLPRSLVRGMKNVSLDATPSDVMWRLGSSWASFSKSVQIAQEFAGLWETTPNELGVIVELDSTLDADVYALDVQSVLQESWRCEATSKRESEVILHHNTVYTSTSNSWTFAEIKRKQKYRYALVRVAAGQYTDCIWSTINEDAHWVMPST